MKSYLQSSVRKAIGPLSGPLFLNAWVGRRVLNWSNATTRVSSFSWLTSMYPSSIPPAGEQVTSRTSFVSCKSSEEVASTAIMSPACCKIPCARWLKESTTHAIISILPSIIICFTIEVTEVEVKNTSFKCDQYKFSSENILHCINTRTPNTRTTNNGNTNVMSVS